MSQAAAAAPAQQIQQGHQTVMQGWETFSADITTPEHVGLNDLLRFTYFHAAFDMMARIKAINTDAQQHRDVARVTADMNALVREINLFLNDEANMPTGLAEPEPEAPRLILPPGAGRLIS